MVPLAPFARALQRPAPPPEGDPGAVVRAAVEHGIAGGLAASGALATWPEALRRPLQEVARGQAIWELRHRAVLVHLLRAFEAAGIEVVLHKGTALAYELYDPPSARARGDSDLLIRPGDLAAARAVLRGAGFASPLDHGAGPGARRQEGWSRDAGDGTDHEVDLHWRLSNNPALAAVMPEDEAMAEARPLPALDRSARALAPHQALVHAVLHRAGHRVSPYFVEGRSLSGAERLIWLRDIDLLLRALPPGAAEPLERRALERGIGPLMAEALDTTAGLFGTPLPQGLVARLAAGEAGPAVRFLARESRLGRLLGNLAAEERPLAYARRALFPPEAEMRAAVPGAATRPLAWLYLRRLGRFLAGRR